MPELPEVAYVRERLARHVTGRRVVDAIVGDPTVFRQTLSNTAPVAEDAEAVCARTVGGVVGEPIRQGKRLGVRIGEVQLLVHLGMTGRFVCREESPKAARFGLALDDGRRWWFEDPRKFGALTVSDDLERDVSAGLGPDALDLAEGLLAERVAGRGAIKTRLMDQHRVAGIGNIQATEALWLAHIHPQTRADALDEAQWAALEEGLQDTLHRTLDDALAQDELVYLSTNKEKNPFRCYGRVGDPCLRCGTPIQTMKLGGRTSPFCPGCQAGPG